VPPAMRKVRREGRLELSLEVNQESLAARNNPFNDLFNDGTRMTRI
jgi:hypothetical protein